MFSAVRKGLWPALAFVCLQANCVWAGDVSSGTGEPCNLRVTDGHAETAQIAVKGRVRSHCGITPGHEPAAQAQLKFQSGESRVLPFQINCNGGFEVFVTSANGGLKSQYADVPAVKAQTDFQTLTSYDAKLSVARDDGSVLTETCTSGALKSGANCAMGSAQGLRSSIAAMNKGASLKLQLGTVDAKHMVAGTYQDIISIKVQAQL